MARSAVPPAEAGRAGDHPSPLIPARSSINSSRIAPCESDDGRF
jgi:hypothetical protein